MSFDIALQFVLKEEGGFADDPNDRGGRTMRGITQGEYDSYRERNGMTPQDVKLITDEEVRDIYLHDYWGASHCDAMPDKLGAVVFDTAVNEGVSRALKTLQACLDIKADGIFGQGTQNAVNQIDDVPAFVEKYLNERCAYYARLVHDNRNDAKFFNGWINRVNALRKFVV